MEIYIVCIDKNDYDSGYTRLDKAFTSKEKAEEYRDSLQKHYGELYSDKIEDLKYKIVERLEDNFYEKYPKLYDLDFDEDNSEYDDKFWNENYWKSSEENFCRFAKEQCSDILSDVQNIDETLKLIYLREEDCFEYNEPYVYLDKCELELK